MKYFLIASMALLSSHGLMGKENPAAAPKATAAKPSAVQPFRFYSNFEFDGEHGGGANLWIWILKDSQYVGTFEYHEGDIGHKSAMELESTKIDLKTGAITFSLTERSYAYLPSGELDKNPIKTPMTFIGSIQGKKLVGKLKSRNWSEGVTLEMPLIKSHEDFFIPYDSIEAWRKNTPPQKAEY